MSSVNPVKEFFLLERASAEARAMPEERRSALGHELGIARQRAQAADALWTLGHTAEGLRLVAESLDATLAAVERLDGGGGVAAARVEAKAGAEAETETATESETESETASASESETETASESETEAESESESETETASESESETASEAEAESDSDSDSDSAADAESASESAAETEAASELGGSADLREPSDDDLAQSREGAKTEGAGEALERRWPAVLRERGWAADAVGELSALYASVDAAKLPALDADVSTSDNELFRELLSAQRRVERVLLPAAMTPAQVTRTKVTRWVGAAVIVVLGVVGLYFALRTPHVIAASASGHYASSPEFMPDNVVDGDTDTEWLLPDRASGWLEISLSPPRNISNLRLRNASNPPYFDRATENYTIEAFADGEEVLSQQGSWDSVDRDPDWVQIPVNADGVERIRFTVRSHHETGAGLSEIEWDER